jgi:hypothetical protein
MKLAGWYDNPTLARFLAPKYSLKIAALAAKLIYNLPPPNGANFIYKPRKIVW